MRIRLRECLLIDCHSRMILSPNNHRLPMWLVEIYAFTSQWLSMCYLYLIHRIIENIMWSYLQIVFYKTYISLVCSCTFSLTPALRRHRQTGFTYQVLGRAGLHNETLFWERGGWGEEECSGTLRRWLSRWRSWPYLWCSWPYLPKWGLELRSPAFL